MRKTFLYFAIFVLFSGIVLTLLFNVLIKNWSEDFEFRQEALSGEGQKALLFNLGF